MSKSSLRKGFGFGLTSGVITTLGLMVGLGYSTHSKIAVITGILTIAFADSFSDALGIHISEEAEGNNSTKNVWRATIYTLIFKLLFSSIFLVPVILIPLPLSLYVSAIWGLLILSIFSFVIGREEHENVFKVIGEHFIVAIFVIMVTYFIGLFVGKLF